MGKLTIKLTDEQIEAIIASKEICLDVAARGVKISPNTDSDGWPDAQGYEPAERLITFLKRNGFNPEDLPKLSRWRVGMLCRNNEYMYSGCVGRYLRNYVWERVAKIEEIFGFRFNSTESCTDELLSYVEQQLMSIRLKGNVNPGDSYRKVVRHGALREFSQHGVYTLADFKSVDCRKEHLRDTKSLLPSQ